MQFLLFGFGSDNKYCIKSSTEFEDLMQYLLLVGFGFTSYLIEFKEAMQFLLSSGFGFTCDLIEF